MVYFFGYFYFFYCGDRIFIIDDGDSVIGG